LIKPKGAVPPSVVTPQAQLSWATIELIKQELRGMTPRQSDLAWWNANELDPDGNGVARRIVLAWDRAARALQELEAAVSDERRSFLLVAACSVG
jgi:hypothetical protein